MPETAKLKVGFLLMPNFTLTAFASFIDVLRLSADEGDRSRPIDCSWQVMGLDRHPLQASCGVSVLPTSDLTNPAAFDYLVVVGGLLRSVQALPKSLGSYLHRAAGAGVTLVGVCTGSFILCRLGLMTQHKCCVSWYHYRDFLEEFPGLVPVADRMFVIDGKRITCSGGTGVADLAAQIVSERLGRSVAQKALHILLVNRPRSEMDAQPSPPLQMESDDIRVSRALLLMEQNLAEPLSISNIARHAGVSVRQLERVFGEHLKSTPQEAYLALRLRHGRWMLGNNEFTSSRIAAELGFSDASHFGRSFKSTYGTTPAAFRRQAKHAPREPSRSRNSTDDVRDRRIFD
jgi:transcriptional regulator GlxA family with amidase domain